MSMSTAQPDRDPETNESPAQETLQTSNTSHARHTSNASLGSSQSRKEYMDSLIPPSKEEFAHIADVQAQREAQDKRRSRDLQRMSLDSARRQAAAASEDTPPKSGPQDQLKDAISSRLERVEADAPEDSRRAKAAALIQRTYRGYRVRRQMRGLGIDASTRWVYAIREAQFRLLTEPKARADGLSGEEGRGGSPMHSALVRPASADLGSTGSPPNRSSAARKNWKKVATIARHAGGYADTDDSSSSSSSDSSSDADRSMTPEQRKLARRRREEAKAARQKTAKTMGLQYFLEMVDLKHRYGASLRTYHEEWKKADTNENFFYWLDYGEGRFLDMAACPRERLDREQVRYLSREERQYYLVTVDSEGRLCWAKNGVRIDTSEKWKDSIHGIVPADDPTPAFRPVATNEHGPHSDSDDETVDSADIDELRPSDSELEAARAAKYTVTRTTFDGDGASSIKHVHHLSATTILNKLLRKSVRRNTWIFVADTSFRLYVGIKSSGAFQHSSFLQGSRISAAGLIKIRNGRLTSLSPLSGHYRPPASNFRAFVRSLRDAGVDMTRVSISKSYAVLVGLEAYVETRRKGKDLVAKLARRRDRIVAPAEARRREEEERDGSESAKRERDVLEKQGRSGGEGEELGRRREDHTVGLRLMQKLHIGPRVPARQKGEVDHPADGTVVHDGAVDGDGGNKWMERTEV